jgi:hypothetical protein
MAASKEVSIVTHTDVRSRDVTLFLGQESFWQLRSYPWMREATVAEWKALKADLEEPRPFGGVGPTVLGRTDWFELFTGPGGEPYMLATVTREAPVEFWLKASGHLRLSSF